MLEHDAAGNMNDAADSPREPTQVIRVGHRRITGGEMRTIGVAGAKQFPGVEETVFALEQWARVRKCL